MSDRPRTVVIIGVGLIGGSIGMALRAKSLARRVIGIDRDRDRLEEARLLGAIDEASLDLAEGVAGADVAVVCTPVTRIVADVLAAATGGPRSILVTDAGSTKAGIVAGVETNPTGRSAFVGAHPITGSERTGAAHARVDLFEGRACVLTPTGQTPTDRLGRARVFWSGLGCVVHEMSPDDHDRALARTSHLPHVVAAALAGSIPSRLLPLAAGAYRDGTRVAGADPALWAGIFRENRAALLDALAGFQDQVDAFRVALEAEDGSALLAWWEQARRVRLRYGEDGKSPRD